MSKLESISLEKIKGASNPFIIEFDKNKNFTVIYGENGTGKSSIVDGFDFVCNESLGSIEDKSLGNTQKGKYVTTLGKSSNELQVILKYDFKEWLAKYSSKFSPTTSGPNSKPNARILRRDKILEFIVKQPSDKYAAIKSFIETQNCDKFAVEVNNLKKNKEHEYEESTRALSQAKEELEKSWKSEGKIGKDYISWAKNETSIDIEILETEKKEISKIVEYLNQLEKLSIEIQKEKNIFESKTKEKESKLFEHESLLKQEITSKDELIDVLESAEKYFTTNPDSESCPVCEQSISPNELKNKISDKLKSFEKIVNSKKILNQLEKEIGEQKKIIKKYQIQLISIVIQLYSILKKSNLEDVSKLEIQFDKYTMLETSQDQNKEVYDICVELYREIESSKDVLIKKSEELNKKINSFNFINGHLKTVHEKTATAQKLEVLNEKIKRLNDIVNNTRNRFVENLLISIQSDIDRMYQKIHPKEDIGQIKLKMDPNKRASLDITAKFCSNENVLPQAYYSESHIDTLGICIFIGLAKLFNSTDTILILDDVVTSVDQQHLSRFLKMLQDELEYFQHTIITTHYQAWRDKYKYGSGNVQLIELMEWSIEKGISHTKSKMYIDELMQYRDAVPMDKQIVASKAGILLELVLKNLAFLYSCKLPLKYEKEFTLGEYLSCFSKNLKKNMKIEVTEGTDVIETVELTENLSILPEDSALRNKVGCHFNESGASYSNEDIKDMADNTISLSELLICVDCGELPIRNRTGSYFECKCKRKRLYPIIEPK